MPVGDEMRRGERDRGDVVAVKERDQHRPDDELDVKAADAALIEQMRNLHYRRFRHRPTLLRAKAGSLAPRPAPDRKSTRLNSSHRTISYAVFCLKKKKKNQFHTHYTQTY